MTGARDPENKFAHRVSVRDIKRYHNKLQATITASCGKVWAPQITGIEAYNLPRCRLCFPPILKLAMAA